MKELTGGAGVSVVFDGVGKRTFDASLACLATRGHAGAVRPVVGRGAARRAVRAGARVAVSHPARRSSTTSATRDELVASAQALFEVVASGAVKIEVGQTYALRDAAAAHRDLEARKTTGSTVLIP